MSLQFFKRCAQTVAALDSHDPAIAARTLQQLEQRAGRALSSYRCRLRPFDVACADDSALDGFIQLKASNAVEAQRLAHHVTGAAVIDVTRMEG
ncbi:hypothetical protein SAMN06265795_12222 [Noviherbaspirillum humi]|uniref:Uncharacterized protein n=1 Tax=Noviherbaspirillum humi TaxID=1688639 RepID=A0A239LDW9_9BURK|nr:DUF3105 domain-containing protein [Noviherbaspirillum humi]SNT28681.1 hypothetical protein SAMN06265795_12222 [Noviherbaspirillum humi]